MFDEHRRETDENRFWFWNSMHFPVPMPAFDVICIDSPYQAVGSWQNRVFAVPPAMGIDYRIVNGYVYISGNPVTDPDKIAERAEFFQQRAGYYYENWSELYGKWRAKMEALIAELDELRVPPLPEYEPDEVAFGEDRNTAFYEVLDAYGRALRLGDLMWQHHFEFLLLGYGAYGDVRGVLQGQPARHPRPAHRADGRRHRRAAVQARRRAAPPGAAGDRDRRRRARSSRAARRHEIDAELAGSEAGRAWLAELEKVKDPWFNMATGDGLYHYYRSWLDDPSIPYASLIGHVAALRAGEQIERPDRGDRARARPSRRGVRGAARRGGARPFNELLALSRTVFPYVEEHKFFCDYWFLTRWWNKIREFGALLAEHGFLEDGEDIFQLSRHEVASALDELVLTWATGGRPLGPEHWPPIVARRKEILERLAEWTPPPALGVTPEAVTDPMTIMLWGVTTERVQEWARQQDGGRELNGAAASPGVVEGTRARGQLGDRDRRHPRRARSSCAAAPRRRGRRSSRRSRRPSPTSAA